MKSAASTKNGRRSYWKHGLNILKRAVNGLGNRGIDKRTATGKALAKWRADLIADLGGDVSVQQDTVVDLAVKSKLLLDSIDVWLLTQPSLIDKRHRRLLPVRAGAAISLTRIVGLCLYRLAIRRFLFAVHATS